MAFSLSAKTKRVQRGYVGNVGSTTSVTIDAADMTNAKLQIIGTSGWRNSGGSGGGVVGGQLTNSTTINFSQGFIEGGSSIGYGAAYWEVEDYV